MSVRTAVRAVSLVAVAVTGWSLNVRWGAGATVRGGPPMQWEKMVVGATLLAAIAAVLVWFGTRPSATGALRIGMRAASVIAALGAASIAFYLRRDAATDNMLAGPGWTWLAIGTGLSVASVAGAIAVRPPDPAASKRPTGKKKPRG
jgi:hypothetical protein